MSDALFPARLTRTAWDDLQYRCKQHDDAVAGGLTLDSIPDDPAEGWVIRVADLIAIGVMRHIADPESYEGVAVPGWTIKRFRYAHHIPAHREQMAAADRWFEKHGVVGVWDAMEDAGPGYPEGGLIANGLAFRDPDGMSAPSDATQLAGWTLYTGNVFHGVTVDNGTTKSVRLDGQPVGDDFDYASVLDEMGLKRDTATSPTPAPQPPAVKVGDRVLVEDAERWDQEHWQSGALPFAIAARTFRDALRALLPPRSDTR